MTCRGGDGEEGFGLLLICYVSARSKKVASRWRHGGCVPGRKGEDAGRRRASKHMRGVGGGQIGSDAFARVRRAIEMSRKCVRLCTAE